MDLRRILGNSAWIIADKLFRMGGTLIFWVSLARYLGPEEFGAWNYAAALVAVAGAVASMGLDGLAVRDLVRHEEHRQEILGTVACLRAAASLVGFAGCIAAAHFLRPGDSKLIHVTAIMASAQVMSFALVVDFYFQSKTNARKVALATSLAFAIATIVRLALVYAEQPTYIIALTFPLETTLMAALLIRAYMLGNEWRFDWKFSLQRGVMMLRQSWPLLASALAVMIYMRMDQVMLAYLASDLEVGIFSASLRVSEVWHFIPIAIVSSAFPTLLAKREASPDQYEEFIQRLYDAMAWLGILTATTVTVIAPQIIQILYGSAYARSADVLSIQIWASVTVAMSFVHSRWLLAEGLQSYGMVYTFLGCAVNLALNFFLIPKYGALGSAWATLGTQVGLLPVQLIFPKARHNFNLMIKAPFAPIRFILKKANASRNQST